MFSRFLRYLERQENSRECPGETISVSRNKRLPKFLLNHSKKKIASAFLVENPDIKASTSVLLRDWPANFKTPSNRDLVRNACPKHANIRHLVTALHKAGIGPTFSLVAVAFASLLCARPWALILMILYLGDTSVLWVPVMTVLSFLLKQLQ